MSAWPRPALAEALARCKRAMGEGRPYLVDVKIERRFEGKDSDAYGFFGLGYAHRE